MHNKIMYMKIKSLYFTFKIYTVLPIYYFQSSVSSVCSPHTLVHRNLGFNMDTYRIFIRKKVLRLQINYLDGFKLHLSSIFTYTCVGTYIHDFYFFSIYHYLNDKFNQNAYIIFIHLVNYNHLIR